MPGLDLSILAMRVLIIELSVMMLELSMISLAKVRLVGGTGLAER